MTTLWTPDETAEVLHTSPRTLERRRLDGTGPKFVKLGRRVLYRPEDVETHVSEHTFSNTDNSKTSDPHVGELGNATTTCCCDKTISSICISGMRIDRATQHREWFSFQHNSGSHSARVPNRALYWVEHLFFCLCAQDTGALSLTS